MAEGEISLRDWLSFHRLGKYYQPLHNYFEYDKVSDFAGCTEEDLQEISTDLKMKSGPRSRLRSAIREIPGSVLAAPRIVVIEKEESEALNKLKEFKVQAEKELEKVVTRIREVDVSSRECTKHLENAYKEVALVIAKMKVFMAKGIASETQQKMSDLRGHQSSIESTIAEIVQIERQCCGMLKTTDYSKMANRKTQILENVAIGERKFKHIVGLTLAPILTFDAKNSDLQQMLEELGTIGGLEQPPEITSISPGPGERLVQVNWKPSNSYSKGFEISLQNIEEKEQSPVRVITEQYGAGVTYSYLSITPGIQYSVQIRSKTKIGWGHYSEAKQFRVPKPLGKIQGVTIHSHRKHYPHFGNHHPNNLLNSENSMYGSATSREFNSGEVDWIIFELEDVNQLELIKLRNHTSVNCGVKDMNIRYSRDLSNWMGVSSTTVAKTEDFQEFPMLVFAPQYVKLEFVNPQGSGESEGAKYVLHEVQFWGC